ncbi:hypothetical protein PIIN_07359 [Serendipita indica DSM 11827]|uniref:Uncharacterized protein n=1 Tax=Serendipita indica (strain DSM 11827) TaxID=1109443 RepID=G4TQ12_SERID|nr:hypothetical protein PIIN_07359 [Serendipita indica DSM 11827]
MFASLLSLLTLLATTNLAYAAVYEAEDGTLSGTTVDTATSGYSGTGYVTGFTDSTTSLSITVSAGSTGLYDFSVTYAAPYGEKYTAVSLNGSPNGEIHFTETTTFTTVSGGQLLLNEGQNIITFNTNWGWYFIDKIELNPAAPPAPHQVTGELTNPNASAAAKNLMAYLVSQYGKHLLSGQQDPASYAWVETNIGKSPAIIGLDMMDYSPSRVEHGTTSTAVQDAVTYDGRDAIVAFCWHWNAPTDLIDSTEYRAYLLFFAWWRGFYTQGTTFDLAAALADPQGDKYALLIRDMDAIAEKLKTLQNAGIPVLWRPLHEAEGGWFWWGRDKNPEPAKASLALWRIMYDRFTNHHQLNNLIWNWNSVATDWYPGDDVVDILSYDSYPPTTGDHGAVSGVYSKLVALGQDKKLVTLSEVGEIPDPDLLQAYHADWSYFVTWNGDYISGGSHNSVEFLNKLYNSDYVYNLDDIAGWKNFSGIPTTSASTSISSPTSTSSSSSTPPSTTTPTSSSTLPSSSTTSTAPVATQSQWGQCGGTYYTGPTQCATGLTCVPVAAPWYYQCLKQ